jgi:hypothetical protein
MMKECINDCYTHGEGHRRYSDAEQKYPALTILIDSPALGYLLAINERCTFGIDMSSTENSESLCMAAQ